MQTIFSSIMEINIERSYHSRKTSSLY